MMIPCVNVSDTLLSEFFEHGYSEEITYVKFGIYI